MRTSRIAFAFAGLISFTPSAAFAQAWVGEQHEVGLALTTQLGLLSGLRFNGGSSIDPRFTGKAVDLALGIDYVPIDALAVRLQLPLRGTQYTGPQMAPAGEPVVFAHGEYDDGSFHFTPTDASLELAYMFFGDDVALTPFVRGTLPMADYEWSGYAAAGLGLKQLALGLAFGVSGTAFSDSLHRLFLELRYSYSLVERFDEGSDAAAELNLNRSDAYFQGGYFVLDSLALFLTADLSLTHGGLDLTEYPWTRAPFNPADDLRTSHDPLLQQTTFFLGAGVFYQVTDGFGLNAGARFMILGNNVLGATIIQLGLSYNFSLL